jgi:hypothetical protein
VKVEGPFQVNSPTINATQMYEKDRIRYEEQQRKERIMSVLKCSLGIGILVLLLVAFGYSCRARTKWPFVTVMLYGIFFVILLLPLLWGIITWLGSSPSDLSDWKELPELYGNLYGDISAWPIWLIFAGMILSQMCLLIIPVRVTHERPKPRRGIWLTAIAAALLYTALLFGIIVAILSAISGDDWLDYSGWILLATLPANWLLWTVVFRRFARNMEPKSYSQRITKWLMRGSILELLIAVPSHIIVRHKDTCCAHGATAAGIAAGLAVMFFAFGPGIYYLYIERINRKKQDSSKKTEEQKPQTPSQ